MWANEFTESILPSRTLISKLWGFRSWRTLAQLSISVNNPGTEVGLLKAETGRSWQAGGSRPFLRLPLKNLFWYIVLDEKKCCILPGIRWVNWAVLFFNKRISFPGKNVCSLAGGNILRSLKTAIRRSAGEWDLEGKPGAGNPPAAVPTGLYLCFYIEHFIVRTFIFLLLFRSLSGNF